MKMKKLPTVLQSALSAAEYAQLPPSLRKAYNKVGKHYEKDLRKVSGIFKALGKSPKFVLRLICTLSTPVYLDATGTNLTNKVKEAKVFAYGFDDPPAKQSDYLRTTNLQFNVERYGKKE